MHYSPPGVGSRENGRERQVWAVLLTGFVRKGSGEGRQQLEKDGSQLLSDEIAHLHGALTKSQAWFQMLCTDNLI